MKKAIYVVIFLAFSFIYLEAQETEIRILEYGDKIRATLPLSSLESEFQFEGKAGDIIVITVSDNDTLSGLYPEIALLNKRGVQIASTSYMDDNADNWAMMPIEIPVDGRYTILVTPGEFSFVEYDVPFTLRLLQPQILEAGIAVRGSVESDFAAYYVFLADTVFTVEYELLGGEFFLDVFIARIQDGIFEPMSMLWDLGNTIGGSLVLEPNRNTLHFIEVSNSGYERNGYGTTGQAEFIITFSQ